MDWGKQSALPNVYVLGRGGSSESYIWRGIISYWFCFSRQPWLMQLTIHIPFLLKNLLFPGKFIPSLFYKYTTMHLPIIVTLPDHLFPTPHLLFFFSTWFTWLSFSVFFPGRFFFFLKLKNAAGKTSGPLVTRLCVSPISPLALQASSDSSIELWLSSLPFASLLTSQTLKYVYIPYVVPDT